MNIKVKKFTSCKVQSCRRENEVPGDCGSCGMVEAEREQAVENLKVHLSEQRHDVFNLLQVLYGYTQLKKPDKVLTIIKDYCAQMENIGRLYNCKCIKLADLLYTKGKEAESIDLKLMVRAVVSFEPVVRILDDEAVIHAVDHAISNFLYAMDSKGYKNAHVMYELKEEPDCFRMEIFCREIREGQLPNISFDIPMQAMYWKKIARSIMGFEMVVRHCTDNGFEARLLEDEGTFVLSICKPVKE